MIEKLNEHIQKRNTEGLIPLIAENPSILDEKDKNGSTGFMLIAYSNLPKVFEKAIQLKTNFTFHESILAGKFSEVEQRIREDETLVNQYSNDGFTPLSLAAFFSHNDIAKLLLSNGADPNLKATNPSQVNALHSAVARQNVELVELFIKHGADVNAVQSQSVSPLHSAAHSGNMEIVELLVDNGASINHKMDNGDSAVSIAKRDGHTEILAYLEKNV